MGRGSGPVGHRGGAQGGAEVPARPALRRAHGGGPPDPDAGGDDMTGVHDVGDAKDAGTRCGHDRPEPRVVAARASRLSTQESRQQGGCPGKPHRRSGPGAGAEWESSMCPPFTRRTVYGPCRSEPSVPRGQCAPVRTHRPRTSAGSVLGVVADEVHRLGEHRHIRGDAHARGVAYGALRPTGRSQRDRVRAWEWTTAFRSVARPGSRCKWGTRIAAARPPRGQPSQVRLAGLALG